MPEPNNNKRIEKSKTERNNFMKYTCMLISVANINAARKFYEDLFGLEVSDGMRYTPMRFKRN